jgi:SAM-dependent methyltransferase
MVGEPGAQGGRSAELTPAVRASNDAAAGGWASGPGPMYTRLAEALIAAAPVPLAGRRVLDLGAGAGAAGRAALAAGAAQVVAADLATGMLRATGTGLLSACGWTPSTPKSPSARTASDFMPVSNSAAALRASSLPAPHQLSARVTGSKPGRDFFRPGGPSGTVLFVVWTNRPPGLDRALRE